MSRVLDPLPAFIKLFCLPEGDHRTIYRSMMRTLFHLLLRPFSIYFTWETIVVPFTLPSGVVQFAYSSKIGPLHIIWNAAFENQTGKTIYCSVLTNHTGCLG